MRILLTISVLFFLAVGTAQAQQAAADTTVYSVATEMPRFPGCEHPDSTADARYRCAQQRLLEFVYSNVEYPLEARQKGNEGTVVVSFIVELDGSISDILIVKNVDGGCGDETVRVVNLMNEAGLRWVPARQEGKPRRVRVSLPVRFKLEEALPYIMVGYDTVYTEFDTPLEFMGGEQALADYIGKAVKYPPSGNAGCLLGDIAIQLIVYPDKDVRILHMTDFNDLGFDFWFEAAYAAAGTLGKWTPAQYEGRDVPSAYDLSISFTPTTAGCKQRVDTYAKANRLAEEGEQLYNSGEHDAGIAKFGEAIALFPDNAAFRFMRGQAYLNQNKFAEACADLFRGRQIAMVTWFDNILGVICR
jgi:TonB family protein